MLFSNIENESEVRLEDSISCELEASFEQATVNSTPKDIKMEISNRIMHPSLTSTKAKRRPNA